MKNKYTTDATFVSADGKTVYYQDLFEGAANYATTRERRGFISEADAEDLAQEAAIKIWLSSGGYDTRKVKAPGNYGYTVAKNRYLDDREKASRLYEEPLSSFEMTDDEGHSFYSSTIDSWRSYEFSADRETISNETCEVIERFINDLDYEDRVTMKMTAMGAKAEAIAQTLGCTPTAAAIRLCKLRKHAERVFRRNDIF